MVIAGHRTQNSAVHSVKYSTMENFRISTFGKLLSNIEQLKIYAHPHLFDTTLSITWAEFCPLWQTLIVSMEDPFSLV